MPSASQRAARIAGALLLVGLLLVPLAVSGHAHSDNASRPCATCVVTHHSPAAAPAVAVLLAVLLAGLVAAAPSLVPAPSRACSARGCRAPPRTAVLRIA